MHPSSTETLLIGAHTSATGGVHNALLHGQEIGATTIQLFTSNQRRWEGKPLSDEEVSLWKEAEKETGITKVMSHASYLLNLASPVEETRIKSQKAFKEELHRCHQLRLAFLNFHPGAALKESVEKSLDTLITSLKMMRSLAEKGPTLLLFETTAGQGSTLGRSFEEIGYLIERLHPILPVGVCIDTCHIFAAGYDIRTEEAWNNTLDAFDQKIGLKYLKAFHVNDSMKPFASHRDRHAELGKGEIGMEAFKVLMQNEKLRKIPKYLETPEPAHWKKEIEILRKFAR